LAHRRKEASVANAYLCPVCGRRKVQYISVNVMECKRETGGCGSRFPKEQIVKG